MQSIPNWLEAESEVHRPGLWLPCLVGTVFVLAGCVGLLTVRRGMPPGASPWVVQLFMGVFCLAGGGVLVWVIRNSSLPIKVRHAVSGVLPNVPTEPVICEGAMVHGRLTHELCETDQGWEFRPAEDVWRNDQRFLFGFGLPFLVLFSGLLTWVFHSQLHIAGWPLAAVYGTVVTAVCGGGCFVLIGLIMRSGYHRLSKLTIPRNGNELELELAEPPKLENADLTEGLKWLFIRETRKQRLTIPQGQVVAVQLCPWKFVMTGSGERSTTWAVQGLLVVALSERADYHRLPILLTSDFVGAAQLLQRLASAIQVPYLFCADAKGWQTEEAQAKSRPPLRSGGYQS